MAAFHVKTIIEPFRIRPPVESRSPDSPTPNVPMPGEGQASANPFLPSVADHVLIDSNDSGPRGCDVVRGILWSGMIISDEVVCGRAVVLTPCF